MQQKSRFGLIGRNISYSFSQGYFTKKFEALGLENCSYENFDIPSIEAFDNLKSQEIQGFNVTIPYKEVVIPKLNKLHKTAKKVGAVNTIKVCKDGSLKGYNTDVYGFKKSLQPLLKKHHKKALIFGTGGASKAIAFVLKKLNIKYKYVSRTPKNSNELSYAELSEEIIKKYTLLIDCTPLGTFPNVDSCIEIPYKALSNKHLLYDLTYNPTKSLFLQKGEKQGAAIKNGLEMLQLQAEKAWKIWN